MKSMMLKPILAMVLMFALFACNEEASKSEMLTAAKFEEKIKASESNQIIDVRTPSEYETGHLKSAVNINIMDDGFKDAISKLDKSVPIFVHCAAGSEGGRSDKTTDLLEELGFEEIYELEGGITSWTEAGFETVK